MQIVIQYILTAILSWCPPEVYFRPYGETVDQARERLSGITTDIVTVAFDKSEPPVFTGGAGRVKTALLQAAIASKENAYQRFVDEGACNKPDYVADRRGTCDGGHAFSLWSLHVFGGGYLLLGDGTITTARYVPTLAAAHPELVIDGPALLADRKTAIRVAQRLERRTLRQYHSLCEYTGESCDEDRHPKAVARYELAHEYFEHHPFPADAIPEPIEVPSAPNVMATISTLSSSP